ncbi:hypothetical protein WA556_000710 [Blastocystis sp. ATCC 50177/Nand II]
MIQELYGTNDKEYPIPAEPKSDKWLIREMKEGGFSEDVAKQIDSKFIESTKFVYEKEFLAKKKEFKDSDLTVSFQPLVDNCRFEFTLPEEGKKEVTIHKTDYEHLKSLYEQKNPPDPSSFHACLLLLLLRYNTISGTVRGYQMALPTSVFELLQSKYHLQHECFASPMNSCALLNSYCSRFRDTDAPFGSKGSFFDYEVDEGVFESNPPFVEECMIRNIKHILDLLEKAEKSGKALTFFIIVPKWDEKDCESYNRTRFTTPDRQTDDENRHFYRNGMGYQDNFSVMAAKNDSLMLVLQTTKAKEANPIDVEAFKKEVEERWNKSSEEYIKNAFSWDKRMA